MWVDLMVFVGWVCYVCWIGLGEGRGVCFIGLIGLVGLIRLPWIGWEGWVEIILVG